MKKRIFAFVMVLMCLVVSVLPCVAAVPTDVPSLVSMVDFSRFDSVVWYSYFGDYLGQANFYYDNENGTAEFEVPVEVDLEENSLVILVFDEYALADIISYDYSLSLYSVCDTNMFDGFSIYAVDDTGGYYPFDMLTEEEWSSYHLGVECSYIGDFNVETVSVDYLMAITKVVGFSIDPIAEYLYSPYNSAYFEVDNSDEAYQDGYNQALQDIQDRLEENGYIDAYMLNYTSSITYSGNFAGSPSIAYATPTVIGDSLSFASSVAAVLQSLNNSNISSSQVNSWNFSFRVDQQTALPVSEELLPVITADAFRVYSSYSPRFGPTTAYINYYDSNDVYTGRQLSYQWDYSEDASNPDTKYLDIPADMLGGRLISITLSFNIPASDPYVVNKLSGLQLSFGSMKGINSTYQLGFEKGYVEGTRVTSGEAVDNAYQYGFRVGREEGYLVGKNEGLQLAGNGGFRDLIGAVVETPINAFNSLFNFTILGMNMRAFFGSILSLCVIIIILKKVI